MFATHQQLKSDQPRKKLAIAPRSESSTRVSPWKYPSTTKLNTHLLGAYLQIDPSGRVRIRVGLPSRSGYQSHGEEQFQIYPQSQIAYKNGFWSKPDGNGETFWNECEAFACPLSLVNRAELQRGDRTGWGGLSNSVGMSAKTRRNVTEIAASMDLEYGKQNLRFATATLPGSTPEAFETLARWSGYAVNRLNRFLDLRLGSNHARLLVWEYQKRGALHLHSVIGDRQNISALCSDEFREKWCEILSDISEKTGVDLFRKNDKITHKENWKVVRADVQKVKKSVTAYLAKYMSKTVKSIDGKNSGRFFAPSSWASWKQVCGRLRSKYTYSKALGYLKPQILDDILEFSKEAISAIRKPKTEVIHVRKYGTTGDCIYGMIPRNFDCMDAMKTFGEVIERTIDNHQRWKFYNATKSEVIEYYRRKLNAEMIQRQMLEARDARLSFFERVNAALSKNSSLINPSEESLQLELDLSG